MAADSNSSQHLAAASALQENDDQWRPFSCSPGFLLDEADHQDVEADGSIAEAATSTHFVKACCFVLFGDPAGVA